MSHKPFVAALAVLSASLAAHADTLDYTLTGRGNVITFSLDQNPVPGYVLDGAFLTDDITVVVNGVSESSDVLFALPGNPTNQCNFALPELAASPCEYAGSSVYFSGSSSSPTLLTGTFTFTDDLSRDLETLVVTDVTATPEPSSIVLLATGLLGVAGTVRRRFV